MSLTSPFSSLANLHLKIKAVRVWPAEGRNAESGNLRKRAQSYETAGKLKGILAKLQKTIEESLKSVKKYDSSERKGC